MSRSPERIGTSARVWGWLSAVLAIVAVACLVVAVRAAGPGEPRGVMFDVPTGEPPAASTSASTSASASASGTPSAARAPVAPPVGLRIPAIDVAADVTRLGLNEDRTVEVPGNPAETGWYRLGPPPGQPGSAVILGHVDSMQGPAVFYRLRHLEPGDLVLVDAADGSTTTFRVLRLATYPNESFPAQEVYAAPGRRRLLNLVTCGGNYDPGSGYQANVVVYTRWVRGT